VRDTSVAVGKEVVVVVGNTSPPLPGDGDGLVDVRNVEGVELLVGSAKTQTILCRRCLGTLVQTSGQRNGKWTYVMVDMLE